MSHVPEAALVTIAEESSARQKAMDQGEMLRRVHGALHDLLEAETRSDVDREAILRRASQALDELTAELYG